jgi:hypothetical protein
MDSDRDETRTVARLPGLDIAILHRGAHSDGGEEVMLALRVVSPLRGPGHLGQAAHPLLFWTALAQAAWSP